MERLTKKKPSSKTVIQMIFTGFDEHTLSRDFNENTLIIFKDLLQYPEQGKIYIGFSTHQTTGCCSHLSARVISTVRVFYLKLLKEFPLINIKIYIII